MEKKIRDLKDMIERKQCLIQCARNSDRDILQEELTDMMVTLRLLEITRQHHSML